MDEEIRKKNKKKIRYHQAKNHKWRLLIYRILLFILLVVNIKYELVDHVGFIPAILLIFAIAFILNLLLTRIFIFFLEWRSGN